MYARAKRFARAGSVGGAFVLAAALLAGCTGGGGDAGGTTTITVMMGTQDLPDEQIAEFESQNPDIKINLINWDAARLNTMLAAGTPPDVAPGTAVGSANINARGLAADLTPYLAASDVLTEDDLQPVNDGFRWDGTKSGTGPIYGIVKDWSHDNTLWYNTALFDQAGLDYLSTTDAISYDELLDIAKKLTVTTGGSTEVYGLGLEWAWQLYGPLSAMVMQQGGSLYNDDLSEIDFTSPEAQKAVQWYVDFAHAGVGPTSLNPLPEGSDFSTFAAERMGISQDGYWFGGNFAGDDALKTVGFAPAPTMGDERVSLTYGGVGLWIPEQSQHKDAAWKFMEYFMAGTPAQQRATSGWGLPSLKSLADQIPQDQPYQKQAAEVAANEVQFSRPLPDSPYIAMDKLNATIDKYLQAAIKGEMSVAEATSAMTDEINEALAQGKEQIG